MLGGFGVKGVAACRPCHFTRSVAQGEGWLGLDCGWVSGAGGGGCCPMRVRL